MLQSKHYSGLTDAEVSKSRAENGANQLTPPPEESIWVKVRDCMHFWVLRFDLVVLVLTTVAVVALPLSGLYTHTGLWIAPLLVGILFFITYLVAYMGGKWDPEQGVFRIDSLFAILLFALLLSGGISLYNGVLASDTIHWTEFFEPIGIAAAVLLATTVAHVLEKQNEKTFKSLNQVNDDTLVKVIRNDNVCQVPRKDVVVGDIILLETGEEVPADAQLLECMNLTVDESSLTGEPLCGKTTQPEEFDPDATYPSNHIMKGCTIMEGDCVARVLAVGDATACGKVYEAAQVRDGEATPLSQKLDELGEKITIASYNIAIFVFLGHLLRYAAACSTDMFLAVLCALGVGVVARVLFYSGKRLLQKERTKPKMTLWDAMAYMLVPIVSLSCYAAFVPIEGFSWPGFIKCSLDAVMLAVTLIVVAVPEGLPMAVTLSLAFSMKRLMKQNTLPRTMHACETMGAVSVICSDKTGTLTQNQMKVVDTAFASLPQQRLGDDQPSQLLRECIAINTTANLDLADPTHIKAIGNPTEGALLLWLHAQGTNYQCVREGVEVVDRLQFSTELKYMATVVKSAVTGGRMLYVKGAPDILLALCHTTDEERQALEGKLAEYQSHANRTLAFACKSLAEGEAVFADGRLCISDLSMMGVVGIEDPVRPDVPPAIQECLRAGIQVKIVTGDAPGTAKEIGRQLGLWLETDTDEQLLIGTELAAMTDDELKQRLPQVKIISRARPNDKERAVRLLKETGYIVAVTGDGTNDAPALNAAHVGLSMGDGTAVAKEVSDMTIIDNSFSTIANAVMWGRSLYKNIKRFILFQMTVNVAACLIVLIGAFVGETSPLTVTQMLWVNLIMDTFAALALASLPPTHRVMADAPRSVGESILKGMKFNIVCVGGIFTVLLLLVYMFFLATDVTYADSLWSVLTGHLRLGGGGLSEYELGLFFTIFVMLQFWNIFNAKAFMTGESAFKGISWNGTRGFIIIALIIFVGQVMMTELPGLQEMFNIAEGGINPIDWFIIIAATSPVLWLGEFIRLFQKAK